MNDNSTASTSAQLLDNNESEDVSLAALLDRAITASQDLLAVSFDLSSAQGQAKLTETLANLSLCASLITHLALLSANESVDELSTPTLRCLLVPYYAGTLELQRRTKDYKTRLEVLGVAKQQLETFLAQCDAYAVVDDDTKRRLFLSSGSSKDPTRRREAKIAQYKEEKALQSQMDALKQRIQSKPFASIADGSANSDPSGYEDEYLRPLILALMKQSYLKAVNELSSISQETELLQHAPNMSELPSREERARDEREKQREAQDTTWRLDSVSSNQGDGLLDKHGKVLRPFTILPSAQGVGAGAMDTRLRLQKQVFGSSHRLPTMTVDEYLAMEHAQGNVLQGGGARNTEESNREAADKKAWEEEEDNAAGYERQEAGLQKKREWDAYTDDHKRGEGNRMNRG